MDYFSAWVKKHREELRRDYFQFLRFASISTEPAFKKQVDACADWVRDYLEQSGLKASLLQTPIHPIVYAESKESDPTKPTVLIYGHYDVQPVDPIDLWESDPFEPTEKDGDIIARGAVDDKGQIFYAMAAMRALKESLKPLPVNVKFCIEGEEEAGSLGLIAILPEQKNLLKADYLLVVDYDSYDEKTPAINLGARGLLSMDVTLTGSNRDLHSGVYGGIAYNPNRALAELLAKLYTEEGKVAVDGFYEDVIEPSFEEKKAYPRSHASVECTKLCEIEALGGEKGRTIQEANFFRPVLEINGMAGGYSGPGFKTVIPAKAIAKISCRLVPNQNPEKIGQQVARFLRRHCKEGIKIEVSLHEGSPAYRANPYSALAKAVASAAEEVMGVSCQRILSGASVPVVAPLSKAIGAEVVGMGYGLPTDRIHAPNERFDQKRLESGLLTVAKALEKMGCEH